MIVLERALFDRIVGHLQSEFPNEGCGLLTGRDGTVEKVRPVKNSEASPVSYLMDPKEQLRIFKEMRHNGESLMGIFHSHVTSEAYPSETDRSLAFFEDAFYMIVSLKDRENPSARVFWIRNGKIEEDKFHCAG